MELPSAATPRFPRLESNTWVATVARVGLLAKGAVYLVIGLVAAAVAWNGRGKNVGSNGALHEIGKQPLGLIALSLVAIGLAAYVLWQLVRAWRDPEGEARARGGGWIRIGFLISAIGHGALVATAIALISGRRSVPDVQTPSLTAKLMAVPFGPWLVAALGLGIAGYGGYELFKAWRSDLDDRLSLGQLSGNARRTAIVISRIGLAAHGLVFGIVGALFVLAAKAHDPNQARGLDGALDVLRSQPLGQTLLAVVALGLVAYGVYEMLRARYRRTSG